MSGTNPRFVTNSGSALEKQLTMKKNTFVLVAICAILSFNACGNPAAEKGNDTLALEGEAWTIYFSKVDKSLRVSTEGLAVMERYPGTDSMYVCIAADIKYDFGTVAVQCLVPGTYCQVADSLSFSYDDHIKLAFEFKDDCLGGDAPAEKDYRSKFSILRVFPVDAMKEMRIIISSEELLVLDSHSKPGRLFDFKRTDAFPSRNEEWKSVHSQGDEILAVTRMSREEFRNAFIEVFSSYTPDRENRGWSVDSGKEFLYLCD